MLKAPEKYLNSLIDKAGVKLNISALIKHYILTCNNDLHFILSEKDINIPDLFYLLCKNIISDGEFEFKKEQKILKINQARYIFYIQHIEPEIELISYDSNNTRKIIQNFNDYIPINDFNIHRIGNIQNRIDDYKELFKAITQADFINNKKLLVIGNRNIFNKIPKEYPACFVSEKENGITDIEYNSPLLPKIVVLRNLNLIDNYLDREINNCKIDFPICVFIGSSKFENSINIIRNYYQQGRFTKVVFIGEKDIKIDLGNNQVPLRWKWTIPEINFLKGERNIHHKQIIIHNDELEKAIEEFYKAVREIENKHTIGLKSIYRFIRRLYYDWNLKQEITFAKLQQIQQEFNIALKQLLIETLGNIFPDFDFDEYQKPVSAKYAEIIKAIKFNNKNEIIKSYKKQIHQFIVPSFLCNAFRTAMNEIANKSQKKLKVHSLEDISQLQCSLDQHLSDPNRNFYSMTANGEITEILSMAKSDDSNENHHKIISSLYGSGKIEKLIERLGRAKSEYSLLLYSIEEKALKYHLEAYISELNKEYNSQDRFKISGVEFRDSYYQFSDYDELIDVLASTKNEHSEIDIYKLTFTDNNKFKLPSTKSVLKVQGNNKDVMMVEDLGVGDKVLIYSNPNKTLLRAIFELKNHELIDKADEYSVLWRNCLIDAYKNNLKEGSLYQQLVKNHFSVSELTFKKYLNGEVMFPRSFSDLIIIAKTINDSRLSFDFLKNTIKPKIEEYRGMEIEYGFKFSTSINNFIISGEADDFISEWLNEEEIENIVSQIPVRIIKEIELITQNNDE